MSQLDTQRVLYLIRAYSVGGVIHHALRQALAEQSLGRQVKVRVWLQKQRQEFDALAKKYDLPIKRVTGLEFSLELLRTYLESAPRSIVHIQSGLAKMSSNVGWLRRLLPSRIPLVLSLNGPGAFEPHTDSGWRERQLAGSRFVSAIIVPSEMERQVQLDAGILSEKVFVVPYIMEPKTVRTGSLRQRLSLQPNTPVVLFCGRMVSQKSPLQTIEAFRSVVAHYPNAVLVMAGDGVLLDKCKDAARELGNGDSPAAWRSHSCPSAWRECLSDCRSKVQRK